MAETDLSVGRTLALAARGRQTLSGATRGRGGDDGCPNLARPFDSEGDKAT
jgi:hypothetical protein